jgi:hypothetical protein
MAYRTSKRWSASDNETLKEFATKRPVAQIAKFLGRTRDATVAPASIWHLSSRPYESSVASAELESPVGRRRDTRTSLRALAHDRREGGATIDD